MSGHPQGPVPHTIPAARNPDEPLVHAGVDGSDVLASARSFLRLRHEEACDRLRPIPLPAEPPLREQLEAPKPLVLGFVLRAADVAETRGRVLGFADALDVCEQVAQQIAEERGPASFDLLAELRTRVLQAATARLGAPEHIIRRHGKV